jgi:hypothetical protein
VTAVDGSMTPDQVSDIAKREWATKPKLHSEFTSVEAYVAFCKAVAAGRVRVLDKPRKAN